MTTPNARTYSINFVAHGADIEGFLNFIRFDTRVLGYWNYIPLVYCVKCHASSTEVATWINQYFPLGNYMVAEILPSNINGNLPGDAWNWFYAPPGKSENPGVAAAPQGPGQPVPKRSTEIPTRE
jgi:hypothetical protein